MIDWLFVLNSDVCMWLIHYISIQTTIPFPLIIIIIIIIIIVVVVVVVIIVSLPIGTSRIDDFSVTTFSSVLDINYAQIERLRRHWSAVLAHLRTGSVPRHAGQQGQDDQRAGETCLRAIGRTNGQPPCLLLAP